MSLCGSFISRCWCYTPAFFAVCHQQNKKNIYLQHYLAKLFIKHTASWIWAVKKISQNAVKNCALFEVARHKPSPPSQKHLRATSSRSLGIRRDFSATNSPAFNFWFFWFKPKEQTKTINQLQTLLKNQFTEQEPTHSVGSCFYNVPSFNSKLQTLNFNGRQAAFPQKSEMEIASLQKGIYQMHNSLL